MRGVKPVLFDHVWWFLSWNRFYIYVWSVILFRCFYSYSVLKHLVAFKIPEVWRNNLVKPEDDSHKVCLLFRTFKIEKCNFN